MTNREAVQVRPATEDDAEAIGVVHHRSIQEIAARDYSPEIIAEWGVVPSPEAVQRFKDAIRLRKEAVWVAELSGKIEGFSALVLGTQEIRAVYVTGNASRKGIGQALLGALEAEAAKLGFPILKLRSSVSAKSFYEKNGYRNLGPSFHKLRSGREMNCYVMEKVLSP